MIIDASEEFLNDTLGIISESEQYKLRYEIGKVINGAIGKMQLYGWGSNIFHQLGIQG
jgi:hypothetical protein